MLARNSNDVVTSKVASLLSDNVLVITLYLTALCMKIFFSIFSDDNTIHGILRYFLETYQKYSRDLKKDMER